MMDSFTQNAYSPSHRAVAQRLIVTLTERWSACWCRQVETKCEECSSIERAIARLMRPKAA